MEKIIEIPEGYEARIEGNNVVIEPKESEDERIREHIIKFVDEQYPTHGNLNAEKEKMLNYLEKQKENKEYVYRPLAGTLLTIAAEQAIFRAKEGDNLVLAFNGAYIPVKKYNSAKDLVNEYYAYLENQKEQKSLSTEEIELNAIAFLEQMGYTCIPPGKENSTERSEDEKIRDEIIIYIGARQDIDLETHNRWCTYLEKQKESELLNNDEYHTVKVEILDRLYAHEKELEQLKKEQKPIKWSEEDEKWFEEIELMALNFSDDASYRWRFFGWLKSLKDKVQSTPHWKPSEEQMKALSLVKKYFKGISSASHETLYLIQLYDDLKKLM